MTSDAKLTAIYPYICLWISCGVILCCCGCQNKKDNITTITESETITTEEHPDSIMNPNVKLIEQAVDAWLFFHLADFKNYEAILRSTEYDSAQGVYHHHLRYRYLNETGGLVTEERDFEVDPKVEGENGIPYGVREV